MSLAAAVAGVNNFVDDDDHLVNGFQSSAQPANMDMPFRYGNNNNNNINDNNLIANNHRLSESLGGSGSLRPSSANHAQSQYPLGMHLHHLSPDHKHETIETSRGLRPIPSDDSNVTSMISVTGANLNLTWSDLRNIEYLTDGGNNWIHTAVMNKTPIVIKQLKPEVMDVAVAINEIEGELRVHSLLDHTNIVSLFGAGFTTNKSRFLVMERLDGGTLTQQLGHDTRIRDRRKRFWKKSTMSHVKVLARCCHADCGGHGLRSK
jgi:hypothetical protein